MAAAGDRCAAKITNDRNRTSGKYRGFMPNLHRDTLGRVVFYGVAVVGDSLGTLTTNRSQTDCAAFTEIC